MNFLDKDIPEMGTMPSLETEFRLLKSFSVSNQSSLQRGKKSCTSGLSEVNISALSRIQIYWNSCGRSYLKDECVLVFRTFSVPGS
ncbi:hypothetical protein CEXT_473701 [Caerostris extrusa]|uniref:Uncharacterized protein n=1 Tax=Caerostris extrusa TaxID=172846 RepID=A0AAV4P301_CAEEX|nr:hypothetical protein CEXT_473701 [Caerostris extrusa]